MLVFSMVTRWIHTEGLRYNVRTELRSGQGHCLLPKYDPPVSLGQSSVFVVKTTGGIQGCNCSEKWRYDKKYLLYRRNWWDIGICLF